MKDKVIDYLKQNYIAIKQDEHIKHIREVTRYKNGEMKIAGIRGKHNVGDRIFYGDIEELNPQDYETALRLAKEKIVREGIDWVEWGVIKPEQLTIIADIVKDNLIHSYSEEDGKRCNWINVIINIIDLLF